MSHSLEFLKLLAHDVRWQLIKALTMSDYRVQELVEQVDQPMNLVSYHLKKLREERVVITRRSDSDARDVYYSLDLERLGALYREAGRALHPVLGEMSSEHGIPQKPLRVLFVCTHNSARSQMAEALMRQIGGERIQVWSAGSQPTNIHPDTIRTMDALGIDIRGQKSEGLEAYTGQAFDVVITVCDRAREVCPTFPGDAQQVHWSLPDPTIITDEAERSRAFQGIARQLQARIRYLLRGI
jgi:ArsR family transcriptional regulator, arsenate/arsenite/antimonite-responsive transcriptional repressor / arsenate reductase (thioredoxin)